MTVGDGDDAITYTADYDEISTPCFMRIVRAS